MQRHNGHLGKFLETFEFRKFQKDPNQSTLEASLEDADLIGSAIGGTSLIKGHNLVIDLDLPSMLLTSTNGRHHLVVRLSTPLSTEAYRKLLKALVEAGILEQGNLDRFELDGRTVVMVPWKSKPANAKGSDDDSQVD
jgi:hypothetical protein